MATLWGGRFTEDTDSATRKFNDSFAFDSRLWYSDITGSIAHARMLGIQGIIPEGDAKAIVDGLESLRMDIMTEKVGLSGDYEDIHSFVEAKLIERIGEVGKKLHTGRSRNDQVALDMKLYVRGRMDGTYGSLLSLLDVIVSIMDDNKETIMPGFTHLQKAQPTTLAHHMGAYFEMFYRDATKIYELRQRMNTCPLGAGALCGTTYPLDRDMTAKELGFRRATLNSMDSVSDRDYLIDYLSALSVIMMHLSRFSEEIIIWNSNEYGFVELSDAYSTGSSIMPQKKNPDIAELIRGKTGRVYGALMSILTTMKGLPLAYNKDMQEDKEMAFDAFDTVDACLDMFKRMIKTAKFNGERMERSAAKGFTNATDLADYLVKKGMAFRDAHGVVGSVVLSCIEKDRAIEDMSLLELKEFSELFEEDVFSEISLRSVVEKRVTKGSPGFMAIEAELAESKMRMEALVAKQVEF